jgi:hypothetical protein
MEFGDYSPSSCPSPAQQRDALQKGLGRALQWALNGRLRDEPLLEACLEDKRFDRTVDDSRAGWLWQIVRTVGAVSRFRTPLLHALYDLADDESAEQLCQLGQRYAETGDQTFRERLYEITDQKPFPDSPWLGEEQIVALDGEKGFLFAARLRGRQLATRQWDWHDRTFVDSAVAQLGLERVRGLLEGSPDAAVKRFAEAYRRHEQGQVQTGGSESHGERMIKVPAHDVIRAAHASDRCYWFRGWGIHASHDSLRAVLEYLWIAREPTIIAKLLIVFSARALPQFDPRLIEFCGHIAKEVRSRALIALEQNKHPLVRDFALRELRTGLRSAHVAGLFINNYVRGDEQRLLEALEFPADNEDLHSLLMEVVKILEKNPEAGSSELGVISYVITPCAFCRFRAARLLVNRETAPAWLEEECRHDSGNDCRKLVETAA